MSRTKNQKNNQRYYLRLALSQRLQHIILIVSFTTLCITGLPVRYPESSVSAIAIKAMGGMTVRGGLHRVAAVMLIAVCVYHIFWTLFTRRGHEEFMALLPNLQDAKNIIHQLKYYFGLSKTTPEYDRFNWIEKFEYLAMGWGSTVMILTGFMLWFEGHAMIIFPKWVLDVAKIVHSYEALLAFLAIIIWHFYHVHLNPECFPMNKTWINGLISEEELMKHHPLEYERIKKKEVSPVVIEPAETRVKITSGRDQE